MSTTVLFDFFGALINPLIFTLLDPIVNTLESLSYLGVNSHVIKFDLLDNQLLPIADGLGMQLTIIKYTAGLFLVYPLAAILRLLPDTNLKHLMSLIGGVLLTQWVFGPDWVHSFISSFVTYLICLVVPRKYIGSTAFIWVMGYMTMSHVYRMYVSYLTGAFDFTGTQMVLTMKLTSFAYNLYDGTFDYQNVFVKKHEDKLSAKVYGDRRKYALRELPNPLEFFGYIFCFTCILAGPTFEFKKYKEAIDGTAYHSKDPKSKAPSSVAPGLIELLKAVVLLVLHIVLSGIYPYQSLYDPEWVSATPILQRISHLFISLLASRFKFYFAWKVAEGACVLAGFGFEGYDSAGKVIGWKGAQNMDVLSFETAPNVQLLTRSWNKGTQGWLERYTYHRVGKSLGITYFVSAFWHGLYPGFFVFFMTVPLLTSIERLLKAKLNPIIVPGYDGYSIDTYPKTVVASVYWVLCWLFTKIFVDSIVQTFLMGSLQRCLVALGGFYFWTHCSLLVIYAVLALLPGKKKKQL